MSFTIIKGTFHVVNYSPDGDSIRFQAFNPENWTKLAGTPPSLNENNHVQIRLLGIDSLETHFRDCQQSINWAFSATNFLLQDLEIDGVKWNKDQTMITAAKDGIEGFILAKKTDQYGRPLGFVFKGRVDVKDGDKFFLPLELLPLSLNYRSLQNGQSYPTYYRGIAPSLRKKMTDMVTHSRQAKIGIWQYDKTNKGFSVWDLFSEQKKVVILPKLFRRIVAHLEEHQTIENFKHSLVKSEKILILSSGEKVLFKDIIIQDNDLIKLAQLPENLVYL
jgi:endonuclease YncB( thermonuclease family)